MSYKSWYYKTALNVGDESSQHDITLKDLFDIYFIYQKYLKKEIIL